jgi:hypothetical protein
MSATAPYLDAAGTPLLRESIIGFLDVLGFSHIATAATTQGESQQILERIAAAISDSRQFVRQAFADQPLADPSRWALKFFSDNLVFGYPFGTDGFSPGRVASFAVRCVQRYQLRMALSGFFVRGALTPGHICLTDEIIFGSALIECYQLESKVSIVPRVLLTEPLKDLLAQYADLDGDPAASDARGWICQDIDGWWFVNYLQAAESRTGIDWRLIEQHKASVLTSLATTTRHDVLPKFGWTCRYHNVFCHWHRGDPGYSERHRIDRIDEQSTIHRLSDLCQPAA